MGVGKAGGLLRRAVIVGALTLWAGSHLAAIANAQSTPALPASVVLGDELGTAQREQLFQQLNKQVVEFQREHALIKTLTRLVSPSVVHLDAKTTSTGSRNRGQTVEEAGSGVIIDYKGVFYVVTNRHVIKQAALADITIRLHDGLEIHPTRVWGDEQTDLAVMSLPGTSHTAARLGRSGEIDIGDFVVAVGSPFGLAHSVTYGIISAKGRRDLELGEGSVQFQDFLQTDAAINPGNSGGPLFNLKAEVIGINTAIASNSGGSEGIGFAIPIDMALPVVKQLIDRGTATRAKLGVTLDSKFTYEMAKAAGLPRLIGARVIRTSPGAAAEAAGIKTGDVIVRFNGVTLDNDTHLVNLIAVSSVDSDIAVEVVRDRQIVRTSVRLRTQ